MRVRGHDAKRGRQCDAHRLGSSPLLRCGRWLNREACIRAARRGRLIAHPGVGVMRGAERVPFSCSCSFEETPQLAQVSRGLAPEETCSAERADKILPKLGMPHPMLFH